MSRPRDYSKGKIYKLECLTTGKVYIGSTTKQYLSQRLTAHVSDSKRWKEGKCGYVTSFEIIEGGNYQITLLESYPCASTDELHARERFWIESTECVNRIIPTRTVREYIDANRERIAEQKKHYMKNYYKNNRERIADKNKQYTDANREKLAEYLKQYQAKNKEALRKKRNEKHTCECGSRYTHGHKSRHMRTEKHVRYLEQVKSHEPSNV
jgi:hypothetical protein